jgi:hypothetical protein
VLQDYPEVRRGKVWEGKGEGQLAATVKHGVFASGKRGVPGSMAFQL